MVKIDDSFTQAILKEQDRYEGQYIDDNIVTALPKGASIDLVRTIGATHWSILTKIDTTIDSRPQSFFLKEYRDANAKHMVKAEYESTAALYAVVPNHVPRPYAYGCFASNSQRFFYLQSFCDMEDAPVYAEKVLTASIKPFVEEFVGVLAKVHSNESPTGKFGFHIDTFQGNVVNHNGWCDTWEEYFSRNLRYLIKLERSIQGADPEMDALCAEIMTNVVPRLLRPMESGGNKIKPVLLHGDMWHGNVSVDKKTGSPMLYDAGCLFGHHEFEAAPWRATRYAFNKTHLDAYLEIVPASKPQEDYDDRNELYAVRNNLVVSCCWKQNKSTRQLAIEGMRSLVTKFPDGYEGYVAANKAKGERDARKLNAKL
ncbi:hypothetical protein J4E89_010758 [Alternaria sp. Ai002NY15]|nr:hypothetical protein J4E89_010758 [Alternaria sp. Ai002NY15]